MTLLPDAPGIRLHAGMERHDCSSQKQAVSIELIVDLPQATCMVCLLLWPKYALDMACRISTSERTYLAAIDGSARHKQDTQCKAACSRVDELNLAGGLLDASSRDKTKCTDLHWMLRMFCEGKGQRQCRRQFSMQRVDAHWRRDGPSSCIAVDTRRWPRKTLQWRAVCHDGTVKERR